NAAVRFGREQPVAGRVEQAPPDSARRLRKASLPSIPPRHHLGWYVETGSVIREDKHRGSRRKPPGAERDEVLQHAWIAVVGLAEVCQKLGARLLRDRGLRHVVAPGAGPVATRRVVARSAVDLGDDLHRARPRADALHLPEIAEERTFEIVVPS